MNVARVHRQSLLKHCLEQTFLSDRVIYREIKDLFLRPLIVAINVAADLFFGRTFRSDAVRQRAPSSSWGFPIAMTTSRELPYCCVQYSWAIRL